jgi:hypothetical protein
MQLSCDAVIAISAIAIISQSMQDSSGIGDLVFSGAVTQTQRAQSAALTDNVRIYELVVATRDPLAMKITIREL